MNEDQAALVRNRLEQAERTLRQAEILAEYDEWNDVVNRAYYAMFYGALALLITKDLGSYKHTGVLALIDREFVHTKILPVEVSILKMFSKEYLKDTPEDLGETGPKHGGSLCPRMGRSREGQGVRQRGIK